MSMRRIRFWCTRRVPLAALATLITVAGLGSMGSAPAGATPHSRRPVAGAAMAGTVTNYSDATISVPEGITAGPDGALWFVNWNYSSVERITTNGVISNYPDPNAGGPWAIAVGSDGALWFTNVVNNVIARITTKGVESYYAPATITGPFGITAGPDGALWFTNGGSNTIGRITTDGVVTDFPSGSGSNQQIDEPLGITAGPDGALWFTNYGDNTIGRITTGGVVTDFSGQGISSPGDITVGPDGALWFINLSNNSIGRITTAGNVKNYTDPTMSDPNGIASGPDGALWFTNADSNSIGRITTGGVVTNYTGGKDSGISAPDGIVAGPDGAMWFTDYGNNSIGRITTGPSLSAQRITFTSTPPSNAVVGGPAYSVSATGGGSGNPVVMTIDPSPSSVCSISGTVVSFIGAGTCTIDANQAGDSTYNQAPQVQQKFIVRPPPPTITSPDHLTVAVGSPFSFAVTASGTPMPSISKKGKLPKSVRFALRGKGSASLSGRPKKAGSYHLVIRAASGTGKATSVTTQTFTLTVSSG